MGIGQQDPAAGILPGTERPDTPGQETGTAGTDRVFSVLAVCGQLLRNKTDMADPVKTEAWLLKLKQEGVPVCSIDCHTGKGVKQMISLVKEAARPITEKWLKKGVRNRDVRLMIVGVPNVGKSTLINRLAG